MFVHSYPYSDNHEINLDWIIQQTEAMVASNRELIQEVQTSKEAFINQTETFETALNRQTAAMESLVNSISEYIGIIVDFDPSDVYDIEFLGWAVPRRCPVRNYVDEHGNFHQRVGRYDLEKLSWRLIGDTYWRTTQIPDIRLSAGWSDIPNYILAENYQPNVYGLEGIGVAPNEALVSVNNGSTTEEPSGMFYYELATEVIYHVGEELPFRSSTASVNSMRLNSEPLEAETDSFTIEPETVIEVDSMVETEPMAEPMAEPMVEAEP